MLFNLIVVSWEVHYFLRLTGKTKYFAEKMEIIPDKQETIAMHFYLFASIYIFPYQIPVNTGMYFAHKVVIMPRIKVGSPALQWWLMKKYTKYTSIPGNPVSPKHHPKAGHRLPALSPSEKFCIMNTAAGSLESCHHLSLSSCLLLRIFKVKSHYQVPFWQKNTQKTGLASGLVLQSKWIPSQKDTAWADYYLQKAYSLKEKTKQNHKIKSAVHPLKTLGKQKREKWGK